MAHPYDPDHGHLMFTPTGIVTAAIGEPKPRPVKGRPAGNGKLGPLKPIPGMSDFGKGKGKAGNGRTA